MRAMSRPMAALVPAAEPEVVTAQIHEARGDVMEVRLEGVRLIPQYDDGHSDVTIDPAYRLGTPFNLRIVAGAGRIEVFCNGVPAAKIPRSGSGRYFETGSYLQSNPGRGDAAAAVAQVALYSLRVMHSGRSITDSGQDEAFCRSFGSVVTPVGPRSGRQPENCTTPNGSQ